MTGATLPMRGHLSQPLHTGFLHFGVRLPCPHVDPAGNSCLDDGFLQFPQQRNQLLSRLNVSLDVSVGMVEKTRDGGLFGEWREPEDKSPKAA